MENFGITIKLQSKTANNSTLNQLCSEKGIHGEGIRQKLLRKQPLNYGTKLNLFL